MVMVFFVTVPQRGETDHKGSSQQDYFHKHIVDDVDSEKWKAGNKQRHHSTVDGTGYGCGDSQGFPIKANVHKGQQKYIFAIMLQILF